MAITHDDKEGTRYCTNICTDNSALPTLGGRLKLVAILLSIALCCSTIKIANRQISFNTAYAESGGGGHGEKASKPKENKKSAEKKEGKEKGSKKSSSKERSKSSKMASDEPFNTEKLDIVLLIDSSGSMNRTDPRGLRYQGAKLFLRFLQPSDRLALLNFDKETQLIKDFTFVTESNLKQLDQAIDSAPKDGRFTNLYTPIEKALGMLTEKGRLDASKHVVLLSDGKMDPHPRFGDPEDMSRKLLSEIMPQYATRKMHLYTISFSPEADAELLGEIAASTNALHWFTPDVNSVHLKFSDLFLNLKTPQMQEIQGEHFIIDSSVKDATFYIHRNTGHTGTGPAVTGPAGEPNVTKHEEIELYDPDGKKISVGNFPSNVRWYRAEQFDLITINGPKPGKWTIGGLKDSHAQVNLISDQELQVLWPSDIVPVGQKVIFHTRLVENNNILENTGLRSVLIFSYQIFQTKLDKRTAEGTLLDNGNGDDEVANDGIYTGSFIASEPGEYKAIVGVSAQTFVRQQHIPFRVDEVALSLRVTERDEFLKQPEMVIAQLSEKGKGITSRNVHLQVVNVESQKTLQIPLAEESENNNVVYKFPTATLPSGNFHVAAVLEGENKKGLAVKYESNSVKINVVNLHGLTEADIEREEDERQQFWYMIAGVGIILLVGIGCFFVLLHKLKTKTNSKEKITEAPRQDDFADRISRVESRLGDAHRELSAEEKEILSLVAPDLNKEAASQKKVVI